MVTLRRLRLAAVLATVLAAVGLAAPAGATDAPTRVLPLATGDVTGSYFPAGLALCRVVNAGRRDHGLRCAAEATGASVDNIGRLRRGEAAFAIVQSDVQAAAWRGTGPFAADGPFQDLRAMAALFPEPLTLVVRSGAGVDGLADLPGKRVGVGAPGSGQRPLLDALFAAQGWGPDTFAETQELDPRAAVAALCDGRLDAFFYAVGHPALAVQEATAGCGATLADVAGPAVDRLVAETPFYFAAAIPRGTYRGTDRDVRTFGVGATLVARDGVAPADVEVVLGAILDQAPALAGFDPTLAALDPATAASRGLTAPLHPGAEAAYRARGLAP